MYVFVYGTLTSPTRVRRLVDSFVFVGPAVLDGLHPVDGRYPTLAPEGETPGRLLRTPEIEALDAYEGVNDGLYVRVGVPLNGIGDDTESHHGSTMSEGSPTAREEPSGPNGRAAVYVGDPDRLDVDVEWPGHGPFANRVRRYVRTAGVGVYSYPE